MESFAETTGGEFSENDIVEFEEELLQKLQWLVNPPNLNTWCNRMSSQWDVFVQKDPSRVPKRELCELMLFKNSDEKVLLG
ncbi:MAG: hypothetical protein JST59_01620 [Actinobacteria bacterium]|nr:hypothetical protein [Actinomycetota bacterium]